MRFAIEAYVLAGLIVICYLSGCTDRQTERESAKREKTFVAFGTSLTAEGAWVSQLQAALDKAEPGKVRVINSGGSGMASPWGVGNLQERVLDHEPDLVFMEFAMNDAFLNYNIPVAASRSNLENMILQILTANSKCRIVLMTMNPPTGDALKSRPKLEAYNQMYREVAAKHDLLLIDHSKSWMRLLAEDRALFERYVPDGLHPNSEGCGKIITPIVLRGIGY